MTLSDVQIDRLIREAGADDPREVVGDCPDDWAVIAHLEKPWDDRDAVLQRHFVTCRKCLRDLADLYRAIEAARNAPRSDSVPEQVWAKFRVAAGLGVQERIRVVIAEAAEPLMRLCRWMAKVIRDDMAEGEPVSILERALAPAGVRIAAVDAQAEERLQMAPIVFELAGMTVSVRIDPGRGRDKNEWGVFLDLRTADTERPEPIADAPVVVRRIGEQEATAVEETDVTDAEGRSYCGFRLPPGKYEIAVTESEGAKFVLELPDLGTEAATVESSPR